MAWADMPRSKAEERQSTFSIQGLSRTNSLLTLLGLTTPQMVTLWSTPGSSMTSFYHLKLTQAELKRDLKCTQASPVCLSDAKYPNKF